MIKKIFLILFIFLNIQITIASPAVSTKTDATFLSIADIHFNPFASCEKKPKPCILLSKLQQADVKNWEAIFEKYDSNVLADYFSDTNYALLKSTLIQIHSAYQQNKPNFTLILGDFLPHHFRRQYVAYSGDVSPMGYQNFVKKTLQFLALEIRQAIPNQDIYPVIGNNDSYKGDYRVTPHGSFLQDAMHIWSTWVTDKNNQYSFQTLFPTAGYYSVDPEESQNQRIIVLNSILFAKAVKGTQTKEAALSELNWLHAQLTQAAAKHTKVIIALHIPPIMQVYGFDVKDFWQSSYSDMFNKDLKTFSTTISAVIAGHLHYDHFEWTTYQNSSVPISVTPAVSPAFGSDPAFKIYHYDPNTFTLKSIDGYFYPLKNKGEPNVIWQKKISNNYAGD